MLGTILPQHQIYIVRVSLILGTVVRSGCNMICAYSAMNHISLLWYRFVAWIACDARCPHVACGSEYRPRGRRVAEGISPTQQVIRRGLDSRAEKTVCGFHFSAWQSSIYHGSYGCFLSASDRYTLIPEYLFTYRFSWTIYGPYNHLWMPQKRVIPAKLWQFSGGGWDFVFE
jgi:hypothetical protein